MPGISIVIGSSKIFSGFALLACVLCVQEGNLTVARPQRPKVLGVAHMAVFVKDLAKTRQFYEDFLGFAEPFTLPKQDHTGTRIVSSR